MPCTINYSTVMYYQKHIIYKASTCAFRAYKLEEEKKTLNEE